MRVHARLARKPAVVGKGVGTHGDNRRGRGILAIERSNLTRGLKAIDARHHDVHQHHVVLVRCARGKRLNGRLAILSMRHDGTGTAERKLRDLGIQIVILYEQNAQALERIAIARIRANCLRNLGALAFLERQADGKRRPLPQDARKAHGSAHKLDQLFCDRRAQASSR